MLSPEGTVMAEGEIWRAEIDEGTAQPDEKVTITCIKGLKLFVTKIKEE
jgi:membrane-bound ClpP family serine protease